MSSAGSGRLMNREARRRRADESDVSCESDAGNRVLVGGVGVAGFAIGALTRSCTRRTVTARDVVRGRRCPNEVGEYALRRVSVKCEVDKVEAKLARQLRRRSPTAHAGVVVDGDAVPERDVDPHGDSLRSGRCARRPPSVRRARVLAHRVVGEGDEVVVPHPRGHTALPLLIARFQASRRSAAPGPAA